MSQRDNIIIGSKLLLLRIKTFDNSLGKQKEWLTSNSTLLIYFIIFLINNSCERFLHSVHSQSTVCFYVFVTISKRNTEQPNTHTQVHIDFDFRKDFSEYNNLLLALMLTWYHVCNSLAKATHVLIFHCICVFVQIYASAKNDLIIN